MPAKRMRIEIFDQDGNRYTVALEGKVTREKALCLLDIVELLGGVHEKQGLESSTLITSKFDKTQLVLQEYFPFKWFSSRDVLHAYEQHFDETICLSTISTYLSRLASRGFLLTKGPANHKRYRMMSRLAQNKMEITRDR